MSLPTEPAESLLSFLDKTTEQVQRSSAPDIQTLDATSDLQCVLVKLTPYITTLSYDEFWDTITLPEPAPVFDVGIHVYTNQEVDDALYVVSGERIEHAPKIYKGSIECVPVVQMSHAIDNFAIAIAPDSDMKSLPFTLDRYRLFTQSGTNRSHEIRNTASSRQELYRTSVQDELLSDIQSNRMNTEYSVQKK